MTAHLTLLGPFSAAIVYTTAKATITITVARANSFSIVSPIKRSQLTHTRQAGALTATVVMGVWSRRLPRSKQIRLVRSVCIAL